MVKIILKRSSIGLPGKQQKTLQALGLRKIGSSVTKVDNKALRGMIHKVAHLVSVEETAKE
jgi:large subunit ribosomal protein L30